MRSPAAADSSEPDALGSFLAELESLRARAAGLAHRCARRTARDAPPARAALAREVQSVHRRVEKLLAAAAAEDGVRLRPLTPVTVPEPEGSVLSECRHVSRDLEEQCAAASRHALVLGLTALAETLQRWRRELIGLERPLIAAHAEAQALRVPHPRA